jgi:hypothetical protein
LDKLAPQGGGGFGNLLPPSRQAPPRQVQRQDDPFAKLSGNSANNLSGFSSGGGLSGFGNTNSNDAFAKLSGSGSGSGLGGFMSGGMGKFENSFGSGWKALTRRR